MEIFQYLKQWENRMSATYHEKDVVELSLHYSENECEHLHTSHNLHVKM